MFGATTTQASHMYLFAISFLLILVHSRAPEGGHVTQIPSAVESADPIARNSWGCKFCKKTSNFGEINPQSIDDNFAKEPLDFVNVNFTKAPLNLNLDEIDTHSIDENFMKNI